MTCARHGICVILLLRKRFLIALLIYELSSLIRVLLLYVLLVVIKRTRSERLYFSNMPLITIVSIALE
jgi:hypothetical protein